MRVEKSDYGDDTREPQGLREKKGEKKKKENNRML